MKFHYLDNPQKLLYKGFKLYSLEHLDEFCLPNNTQKVLTWNVYYIPWSSSMTFICQSTASIERCTTVPLCLFDWIECWLIVIGKLSPMNSFCLAVLIFFNNPFGCHGFFFLCGCICSWERIDRGNQFHYIYFLWLKIWKVGNNYI